MASNGGPVSLKHAELLATDLTNALVAAAATEDDELAEVFRNEGERAACLARIGGTEDAPVLDSEAAETPAVLHVNSRATFAILRADGVSKVCEVLIDPPDEEGQCSTECWGYLFGPVGTPLSALSTRLVYGQDGQRVAITTPPPDPPGLASRVVVNDKHGYVYDVTGSGLLKVALDDTYELLEVAASDAKVEPQVASDAGIILGVLRSKVSGVAGKLPCGFTLGRHLDTNDEMWNGYMGYEPAPSGKGYGVAACKHGLRFNAPRLLAPPLLPVTDEAPTQILMADEPARFICLAFGTLWNAAKRKSECKRLLLWKGKDGLILQRFDGEIAELPAGMAAPPEMSTEDADVLSSWEALIKKPTSTWKKRLDALVKTHKGAAAKKPHDDEKKDEEKDDEKKDDGKIDKMDKPLPGKGKKAFMGLALPALIQLSKDEGIVVEQTWADCIVRLMEYKGQGLPPKEIQELHDIEAGGGPQKERKKERKYGLRKLKKEKVAASASSDSDSHSQEPPPLKPPTGQRNRKTQPPNKGGARSWGWWQGCGGGGDQGLASAN